MFFINELFLLQICTGSAAKPSLCCLPWLCLFIVGMAFLWRRTVMKSSPSHPSVFTCRAYSSAFKSLLCVSSAVSPVFHSSFCKTVSMVEYHGPATLSPWEKLSAWSCCFVEPSTASVAALCGELQLQCLHRYLSRSEAHVLQPCPACFVSRL